MIQYELFREQNKMLEHVFCVGIDIGDVCDKIYINMVLDRQDDSQRQSNICPRSRTIGKTRLEVFEPEIATMLHRISIGLHEKIQPVLPAGGGWNE